MVIDAGAGINNNVIVVFADGLADINDLLNRNLQEGVLRCAEHKQIACHRHARNSIECGDLSGDDVADIVLDLAGHSEDDINAAKAEVQLDDECPAALLCEGVADACTDG